MPSHKPALTRRLALILGLTAAATPRAPRAASLRAASLRISLAGILPNQLDPELLGAELHANAPVTVAGCLHRAGATGAVLDHTWIAARVAEDFAAGRVVNVAGWQLAQTEAWLCAAIHAQG